MLRDSIDKLNEYFEKLEKEVLILSPNFFRGFNCHKYCGGCCLDFTLDYIDGSTRWENFKSSYPAKVDQFKYREKYGLRLWTRYPSKKSIEAKRCDYVEKREGLCTIHKSNPFTCSFEILKFATENNLSRLGISSGLLIKKTFGRAWAMKTISGERGALCEIVGFRWEEFISDFEKLKELQQYYILSRGHSSNKLQYCIDFIQDNLDRIRFEDGKILSNGLVITDKGIVSREHIYSKST